MLRIDTTDLNSPLSRNCDGLHRRDFLLAGALSLGSLSLPQLLSAKGRASNARLGESTATDQVSKDQTYKDRSVVLVYLSGGASQFETFDPKPDAPGGISSVTGSLQTALSGIRFGGTFPELAKRADQISVIRSFQHSVGSHVQAHLHVLSGGADPDGQGRTGFSMGSMVSRIRGANHPNSGLPTFASPRSAR